MQIPTTRARSPKLGRRKTSAGNKSEGNGDHSHQTGRLSLDAVIRKNPAKVPSLANPKKPVRKSLPKLPSERTSLPGSLAKATKASKTVDGEETTSNGAGAEEKCASSLEMRTPTPISQGQEQVGITEPSQTQPDENHVQEVIAVEQ